MPICEPSESTSRTRGTLIASLIRVWSWTGLAWSNLRRGLTVYVTKLCCFLLLDKRKAARRQLVSSPIRLNLRGAAGSGGEETRFLLAGLTA